MAGKGKPKGKPRGIPFEKGKSGNPSGRPALPEKAREFKKISYVDFLENLQKYGAMSDLEFAADLKRKECTQWERIVAKIILGAVQGDPTARKDLLERLWGKVKESQVIDEATIAGPQVIITLPDNGRSAPINTESKK